nr:sigma-70 family RNA polymerase sigma factor [Oleiagrimonas soli]
MPDSLVARFRAGDLDAFEQIYRRFERPAFTLALRLTGQRESAQEVLQDAMLKAFERVQQFRGDAPFWGWLRRLVVNEALMLLRKRGRFDDAPFDEDAFADHAPGPWQHADAQNLERALAELPDTARAVLWLYHVEGYTHVEIAEQFGRTVSFSKSQVARGTQRLRELLHLEPGFAPCLIHAAGNAS